jgi:hypothetical protein
VRALSNRYILMVGDLAPLAITKESERAMFLLIEKACGIKTPAARNLLNTGQDDRGVRSYRLP